MSPSIGGTVGELDSVEAPLPPDPNTIYLQNVRCIQCSVIETMEFLGERGKMRMCEKGEDVICVKFHCRDFY